LIRRSILAEPGEALDLAACDPLQASSGHPIFLEAERESAMIVSWGVRSPSFGAVNVPTGQDLLGFTRLWGRFRFPRCFQRNAPCSIEIIASAPGAVDSAVYSEIQPTEISGSALPFQSNR
jgi:hypothetical protein